ncbi:MAG: transposase [Burkholderiales bacterium]|nr:transposase [Burkholderiales bacterium]MCP5274430.1 transposase [Burkholderiales bacterium]
MQSSLFPWLSEELGPLTEKQQELITTLELVRIEEFVFTPCGFPGRPAQDRAAIARAFVAKMIYNLPTTRALLDRLATDKALRRLCGWECNNRVPDEWTFSRAFAEFADSRLAERVHEALIRKNYNGVLVGHISRDSTAIEAREKPIKETVIEAAPGKRGRPKKGEVRVRQQTRIEKQAEGIALADMIADLPTTCNVGTKKNSKGYKESWIGYKLHLDVADGGIPVSGLLTSASTHDSQVAIPLMHMSDERIVSLYDLMDAAYDAPQIRKVSLQLGHVPLIDVNPRWNSALKAEIAAENKRCRLVGHKPAEVIRYHERSTVERVNARLKDEFGGRMVRVRGHAKVMCHLMFGILALTANQLMTLVT